MYLNASTNSIYSEKNQSLLALEAFNNGYKSKQVAGFKQWSDMGYKIKKGSKAASITMLQTKKVELSNGETEKKSFPKTVKVFFKDQVEKI